MIFSEKAFAATIAKQCRQDKINKIGIVESLEDTYLPDLIPHLSLMFLPWLVYRSHHNTFHNPSVDK